jgi:hypothetical protein
MQGRVTRRNALVAVVAASFGALVRPLTGRSTPGSRSGGWDWVQGDEHGSIGGLDGADLGTVALQAQDDLDVTANHVRFVATDGNYEFEHGPQVGETHLNSYYKGTPRRTPISVGGTDGQDVLSFVVRGKAGQKNDLQQWQPDGRTTLAVDGRGRLRIGGILLVAEQTKAGQRLVAVLPDGTRRILAT